ncbi:hypothetical protein Tco_0640080 [Tanacetum coccineum]
MGYRTMIKSSNGGTPFSLTYKTKVVIPAKIGMPTLLTTKIDMVQNDETLKLNLDLLEEKREQAAIREARSKEKMENTITLSYAEDGGKLGPKWEGSYEVIEALGKGAYKLKDHNGKLLPRTWNFRNLKSGISMKCFVVPVFSPGDDPNACLNKVMDFLTAVASSGFPTTNNQLITSSNPRNQATIQDGRTENLDAYDSDCDDLSTAQAVLMANISNYGSDVISEGETCFKEQIDSLEQNLSKQIKEKESLFETFSIFKNESKEKEDKYMENEIDLEKKIKELIILFVKWCQSAQTMHMLTEPQAFYDNTHKQALGYQNPFHLKKAQRLKPTLYDGVVLSNTHVAMPVIDDEETLILEEESRSKMPKKAKNLEVIAKKISHKPIDYANLNSLIDDFETRFSPQQELSAEQAFWFHIHNPSIESSYTPPVIMEVPSELPKKRKTPNALEEGEWGFEHTKTIFNNKIIPFLKSLKDIFNVFDKDLLNEITEVQTVFDQMDTAVQ